MQLVNSGGEAHMVILDGLVKVNGVVELQKRKKLRVGDNVEFNGEYIVVEK
jgi:ribosome-associated protein